MRQSQEQLSNSEIEELADRVIRWRLATPVALFLELHRPLRNLLRHAAMFLEPVTTPFVGLEGIKRWERILESEESLEAFLQSLQKREQIG